jgi:isopentenyldiphosphate isomerase
MLSALTLLAPRALPLCARSLPSAMCTARAKFPEGQDLSEQFALYHPPERAEEPLPAAVRPQPLGIRKARGLVHRDGDWHRSVHVWLLDEHDRLLLQQRSIHKDTNPGCWDVSCAGHITAGDETLESAQRELDEEIGLRASLRALEEAWLCTVPSQDAGSTAKHGDFVCREFQEVFLLRVPSSTIDELTLGEGEVAAVRFLPSADVLRAWTERDMGFVRRAPHYQRIIADAIARKR